MFIFFNPLVSEFFYLFFGTLTKIGSFRLPTHSRGAHRDFFWWSLLILKSKFRQYLTNLSHQGIKGKVKRVFVFILFRDIQFPIWGIILIIDLHSEELNFHFEKSILTVKFNLHFQKIKFLLYHQIQCWYGLIEYYFLTLLVVSIYQHSLNWIKITSFDHFFW